MNTQTHVLANAAADPGVDGPLAEQQRATIQFSTALNDVQNAGARILTSWRASLQRQVELEVEVAALRGELDARESAGGR